MAVCALVLGGWAGLLPNVYPAAPAAAAPPPPAAAIWGLCWRNYYYSIYIYTIWLVKVVPKVYRHSCTPGLAAFSPDFLFGQVNRELLHSLAIQALFKQG